MVKYYVFEGGILSAIKLRLHLLLGLAFSILLFLEASAFNSYPNTKVLTSDSKGITFIYQAPEPKWEKLRTENEVFDRVTLPQCGVMEETGKPGLPVKTILIGIPLDAGVKVHTQILQSSIVKDVRIAPVPRILKDKDSEVGYRLSYEPLKEVYEKDILFPSQSVKWDDPGFLRHQKVVRVYIHPFQFNPQRSDVVFNKEVKISLSFSKVKGEFTRFNYRDGFESAYKAVILNYQLSKAWRGNPPFKVSPKFTTENPFYLSSDWYKIEIKEEGIYKIDKPTMRKADLDWTDPRTIRIFTSSSCGKMLPRDLSGTPPTLEEVAIYIEGESDGSFDDSDFILFHAEPTIGWRFDRHTGEFSHYTNLFTDENIYWLTYEGDFTDSPLRMEAIDGWPDSPDPYEPKSFRDRIHREMDKINKSIDTYDDNLYDWYWKRDSFLEDYINLSGVVTADTADIKPEPDSLRCNSVKVNGKYASQYGSIFKTDNLKDGLNHLEFNFGGRNYIDWYEIEYNHWFEAKDGLIKFLASDTTGPVKYSVSGFSQVPYIFDISDLFRLKRIINPSFSSNILTFETTASDTFRDLYYLISEGNLKKVSRLERVEIPGLRDTTNLANYIIITYDDFYENVQFLKDLREGKNNFNVEIVKVSDVYNEFSWGIFDPTAIRNFLRYAFLYWNQNPAPEYVLLVGDGNYDYKNNTRSAPPQYIPPWEHSTRRRCTDDNYVYLTSGDLDMILGRLPVRSRREAEIVINKIINYESSSSFGPWRKVIVGVADDEFGSGSEETSHTVQTDALMEKKVPKETFDVQKIYLMNYKRIGRSVPEAQEALIDAYNQGALIIDFIGHGNYRVWAHEFVFDSFRDIHKLHNGIKLPLVYSASCQVGFFDHISNECISEKLVREEGKGAIAAISATRASTGGGGFDSNEELNKQFFTYLLDSLFSVGEALFSAKGWTSPGRNYSLYLLLGDPAMRLGPQLRVDSLTVSPDSLCALSELKIKGKVFDRGGNLQNDFDGIVHLTVYDSKYWGSHTVVKRVGPNVVVSYLLPGRAIFRGEAEVKAGEFEMSFFVPKDISYQGDLARISTYIYNDQIDGSGALDSIKVAGTATGVEADTTGPTINIEFAGQTFQSGDLVVSQPTLKAHIYDEHGINLTGVVGHGITLQVDESQDLIDLTDYFQYDLNTPKGGSLEYSLPSLSPGKHTITLRAWDSYNNPSQKRVEFTVISSDRLVITELMNYPNPFKKKTYFSYQLSLPSEVNIEIFTLAGRLIKTIRNASGKAGYNLQPWDGLDGDGDKIANGVYIYKLVARNIGSSDKKLKAEAYGKAVVMK